MGEKAQRRARFFEAHPWCCYCGGSSRATSIDHNPARSFFPKGGVPFGFTFPACDACNAGRRRDESDASLILSAFNLTDPHDEEHKSSTLRRFRSFVERDPELRGMIERQLASQPFGAPLEIPMKLKLALVRIGRSLFQALYYRKTGAILSPTDHLLVRFATNNADRSEAEWLEQLAGRLEVEEPACVDRAVQPRFVFGCGSMANDAFAFAAEIPGSTAWYGIAHKSPPPIEYVEYFDWFSGDGRLIRSNAEERPARDFYAKSDVA
jgi:hypothetical protein